MAIEVITKFINGATIWVRAYVYDSDDTLTDPTTSIKLTLANPSGTKKVDAQVMTKDGENTGVYDYYYNTDSDSVEGSWSGIVWVVDGSGGSAKTSFGTFSFDLQAGL